MTGVDFLSLGLAPRIIVCNDMHTQRNCCRSNAIQLFLLISSIACMYTGTRTKLCPPDRLQRDKDRSGGKEVGCVVPEVGRVSVQAAVLWRSSWKEEKEEMSDGGLLLR